MSAKPSRMTLRELYAQMGIVFCDECKHMDRMKGHFVPSMGIANGTCKRLGFQVPLCELADSFCSWGEGNDDE